MDKYIIPIMFFGGAFADGRHRIIKAMAEGKRTIKAVRITWRIDPCGVSKPQTED